ncbi:hypothetical protein AB395_00002284 [Sinorhizobium fredii CCBAU 45436]|nr:hypothetical protein AB395_00002284 [Sinorhizobium fredii CCBAU 45436]
MKTRLAENFDFGNVILGGVNQSLERPSWHRKGRAVVELDDDSA